jgi:hypothetical protein
MWGHAKDKKCWIPLVGTVPNWLEMGPSGELLRTRHRGFGFLEVWWSGEVEKFSSCVKLVIGSVQRRDGLETADDSNWNNPDGRWWPFQSRVTDLCPRGHMAACPTFYVNTWAVIFRVLKITSALGITSSLSGSQLGACILWGSTTLQYTGQRGQGSRDRHEWNVADRLLVVECTELTNWVGYHVM